MKTIKLFTFILAPSLGQLAAQGTAAGPASPREKRQQLQLRDLLGTGIGSEFCLRSSADAGYYVVVSASVNGIGCLGADSNSSTCAFFKDSKCTELKDQSHPAIPRVIARTCEGASTTWTGWCADAKSVLIANGGKDVVAYPATNMSYSAVYCTKSSIDNGYFLATVTNIDNHYWEPKMRNVTACLGGGVVSDGHCSWYSDPACTTLTVDSVAPKEGIMGLYCPFVSVDNSTAPIFGAPVWCTDARAATYSGGNGTTTWTIPSQWTAVTNETTNGGNDNNNNTSTTQGLSAGAVAGIAIGSALGAALLAGLAVFGYQKRKQPVAQDPYLYSNNEATKSFPSAMETGDIKAATTTATVSGQSVPPATVSLTTPCDLKDNVTGTQCTANAKYAVQLRYGDESTPAFYCGQRCHECGGVPMTLNGSPGPFCEAHWSRAEHEGHEMYEDGTPFKISFARRSSILSMEEYTGTMPALTQTSFH